jgi:hypothetical protein
MRAFGDLDSSADTAFMPRTDPDRSEPPVTCVMSLAVGDGHGGGRSLAGYMTITYRAREATAR